MLIWILLSTFLISLISFIGLLTLGLKEKFLSKITLFLVALSAGALMGGAFLHLIPESVENASIENVSIFILIGFGSFFVIEKVFHWRHCHKGHCDVHTFAYMNLVGDAIHNFIDGLIISASFLTNFDLGITTTLAVLIHEIPQEIGDFGVLIYGGFKKNKALLYNFLFALFAMLGGVSGYFLNNMIVGATSILVPLAAGGFIYIAGSDLLPELKKEISLKKSSLNFLFFLLGIGLMYGLKLIVEV